MVHRERLLFYLRANLLVWLLLFFPSVTTHAQEEEKMLEMFREFRELYEGDAEEDFYKKAHEYEEVLKKNNRLSDYYKIKCNEGFYDVRHMHIYQAMKTAKELDEDVRKNGDTEYYYLATGLFGDVYRVSYDTPKAKRYYLEALKQVGNRDPKFSMTTYLNLANLLNLADPETAIAYADKSIDLAKKIDNMEFLSLSLATKAFVTFLIDDDGKDFDLIYERYSYLKSRNDPGFNHRYDGVMDAAHAAYNHRYDEAIGIIKNQHLNVDSALSVIRVYTLAGDVKSCYASMRSLYNDLDSAFSVTQNANFDIISTERDLMLSREEAASNRELIRSMSHWIIGLFLTFLIIYILGRRQLLRKIRKQNKELKNALDKVEKANHMKLHFITGMGRELRTPLNVVAGFSQVLSSPDFSLTEQERKEMHERISENIDKLTNAINRMEAFSKEE